MTHARSHTCYAAQCSLMPPPSLPAPSSRSHLPHHRCSLTARHGTAFPSPPHTYFLTQPILPHTLFLSPHLQVLSDDVNSGYQQFQNLQVGEEGGERDGGGDGGERGRRRE